MIRPTVSNARLAPRYNGRGTGGRACARHNVGVRAWLKGIRRRNAIVLSSGTRDLPVACPSRMRVSDNSLMLSDRQVSCKNNRVKLLVGCLLGFVRLGAGKVVVNAAVLKRGPAGGRRRFAALRFGALRPSTHRRSGPIGRHATRGVRRFRFSDWLAPQRRVRVNPYLDPLKWIGRPGFRVPDGAIACAVRIAAR